MNKYTILERMGLNEINDIINDYAKRGWRLVNISHSFIPPRSFNFIAAMEKVND